MKYLPSEVIELIYEFASRDDKYLLLAVSKALLSNVNVNMHLFEEMYEHEFYWVTDYWIAHFDIFMQNITKGLCYPLHVNIIDKRFMHYYIKFKKNGIGLSIRNSDKIKIAEDALKLFDNFDYSNNLTFRNDDLLKIYNNCPNFIKNDKNSQLVIHCKDYKSIVKKNGAGRLMPIVIYIADDLEYFKIATKMRYTKDIDQIINRAAYKILEFLLSIDKIKININKKMPIELFEKFIINDSIRYMNYY